LEAIENFSCPAQNFVFASKSNEIAIWQQGVFPAKWRRQGDFIMPGEDSSYMWQDTIPMAQNPHVFKPERGFVSSANQLAADTARCRTSSASPASAFLSARTRTPASLPRR
jgi:penicillin amidase